MSGKQGFVARWIVGDISAKRFATSFLFIYGSLCVFAFVTAGCLVFRPHAAGYADGPAITKIASANGARISARFFERPGATFTVLHSHGNAEDLGDLSDLLAPLHELGVSVLAYDYQGYGTSEGSASESNVYADVEAAYRFLTETRGIPPERIVLYGRSLGGGAAVDLASRKPVGGLILEATFTSAFRVATRVKLLPWDMFANVDKIARVRCPVLLIHAKDDPLIPISQAETLHERVTAPKTTLFLAGGGHAGIPVLEREAYKAKLAEFFRSLER